MKIKLHCILFLNLLTAFGSNGQNLVINPGFEIYSSCPNNTSQLVNATGWNTSSNSPDFYNACNGNGTIVGVPENICGYQQPFAGDGYIGLLCYGSFAGSYIANLREYATGTLSSSLVPGTTYSVSFNVVLMNQSSHEVDHIGAKFVTGYNPNLPITNSAQVFTTVPISDTLNWTTISGTFVADSSYNFIVIGNHFDDTSSVADSIQPVTFGWNAYYFVDDVVVTELSQPPVALFSASNHICPGTCIDFTNLSTNANSYTWTFTGANPSTSTDVNPLTICYNVPGNYPVQLIASNANGSDTLILNNYITVYPYPSPQGIVQSGDTLFANGGATMYQWYFDGSIIPGATDYFYVVQASGDYNVVATDENGCEVEAVIFNVIAGLTPALSKGEGVTAFPNPVVDKITIQNLKITSETSVEFSIYNMLGEKVMTSFEANYTLPIELDVRALRTGLYYVEISGCEKIFRAKFVKQ